MRRLRAFLTDPVPFYFVLLVAASSTVGVILAAVVR